MEENYFELQNAVYKALVQRHELDKSFCFTLRKNFNKDSYLNYFTGTEKSSYFSFSLWEIKNSYPGASVDPIVYRVIQRENFWRIELQLFQTTTPEGNQNKWVLQLLKNIKDSLKTSALTKKYIIEENKPENRMFKLTVKPQSSFTDSENLMAELIELIDDTKALIDQELNAVCKENPEFDAQRVSKSAFEKMIKDRSNRTEKFKDAIPTFKEIIEEVIAINDLKETPHFNFKEINDGYVWIEDASGIIGNKRAHYEIQYDQKKECSYALIHFEDKHSTEIKNAIGSDLPNGFNWYNWNLGEGIRIGGFEMSKNANTPAILFDKLKSAEEQLGNKLRAILNTILSENKKLMKPLNQILYGPPGTGKTYSTIDKVVEICHADYQKDNHEHNKLLYDQLVKEGRVVFTTFHQSMAYEDFIEGIKPVKPGDDDTYLKYDIEPGVFKQIANTAKTPTKVQSSNVDWDSVNYFKMSIGGKNRPDIHNWCIENNVVGLSWGGEEDLSSLSNKDVLKWENYRDSFRSQFPKTADANRYHIQASYILNKMKIGDIVVISKGNHIIDAIGKITGDYFFDDATPTDMYHFRKVEWIVKDMEAAPEKFIDKQISQQSIYEFYNDDVKKEVFKSLTSKTKVEDKPYVLIIDEINRGNVSAIFGELITLIEDDKRLGAKNELTVTLPYSKEKFGVPSNLYIIGTMNTADRSVEALDTALRRRFTFEEMLPNPSLLKEPIEGISLEKLLTTINERIEVLVDRDHTIGHAFFINDTTLDHLRNTFANKVIPLLQEYFYGDYSKMEMVIGSAFFDVKETNKVKFAVKSDNFDPEGKVYHIKNIASKEVISDDYFKNALNQILNTED